VAATAFGLAVSLSTTEKGWSNEEILEDRILSEFSRLLLAASVASSGGDLASPSFCLHSVGPGSDAGLVSTAAGLASTATGLASTATGLASTATGLAGDGAGLSERLPSSTWVSGSRFGSAAVTGLTEGKQN